MITNFIRPYRQIFLASIYDVIIYRFNFFATMAFGFLPIFVQVFLWRSVYNSGATVETMNGYTLNSIISYFILVLVVGRIIECQGLERKITKDVKDGDLNFYLMRPVNYFGFRFVTHLANRMVYTTTILVPVIFFIFIFRKYMVTIKSFSHLFLFGISLLLALVLNFLIRYFFSLFVFWLLETSFLFDLVGNIIGFFQGKFFPLDLLPAQFYKIIAYLPFQYTLYFPVNLFLGKLPMEEILKGFFIQGVWIFIIFILNYILWQKGLKKYTAVGG